MATYMTAQIQIFKDGLEIVRYQDDGIDVKFYTDDDIVDYAKACLNENQLYNETGLFTVDLVFYGTHSSAMSTQVHIEQANIVQIVSSSLGEVSYRA